MALEGDTEIIDGRKSTPADNGYLSDLHAQRSDKRTNELPDFDRLKLQLENLFLKKR